MVDLFRSVINSVYLQKLYSLACCMRAALPCIRRIPQGDVHVYTELPFVDSIDSTNNLT